MRRILPLELVGNEELEFDLYDDKGQILYEAGEILTPSSFMKLCHTKVFIKDEISEETEEINLSKNYEGLLKHRPVIPHRIAKTLLKISRKILRSIRSNELPDLSICNEAANIIIDEVSSKLQKVDCISQLKIYDEYTFSHTINVSILSCAIAMDLGFDYDEIKEIALGALLHDIGKMFVPKDILNKPGELDEEEFEIMKSHTLLGYKFIKENLDVDDKVAKVALDHHESYYGGSYPNGLKGKEISLYAQITAIVDIYDALTSHKIYKKAVTSDEAIDIMLSECNNKFNPYILHKFMQLVDYKNKKGINTDIQYSNIA